MAHSDTNVDWLKKKDANENLEWWCHAHDTDKFKAVCKLCDKEIPSTKQWLSCPLQHAGEKP